MASKDIQEYLENYIATDLANDPVPIKVYKGSINEVELFGQSMQWAMEYLNSRECPAKLLQKVLTLVRTELATDDDLTVANNNGSSAIGEKLGFSMNGNPNEPLKLMQAVVQITDSVLVGLKESVKMNKENQAASDDSILAAHMNGLAIADEVDSNNSAPVIHGVSYFSMKNQRRTNEDRVVVYPSLNSVFGVQEPDSYFGVFDGHNGAEAAVYGAAQLHQAFIQNMKKISDPREAIVESFLAVDRMFCEKAKTEQIRSGSTVVTAVIRGKMLYVAWLGDSRAVLYHNNKINDLVNPHKPEREDERKRIETEGGEVILMNQIYRVNGNLAVSRSLGDTDFKTYISGVPDVLEIDLEMIESEFLVLASDGLWDVCSAEEVRDSIDKMIVGSDMQDCARNLAFEAKKRDSSDNVSIIVVSLQNLNRLKSIVEARMANDNDAQVYNELICEPGSTPVESADQPEPSLQETISSPPKQPASLSAPEELPVSPPEVSPVIPPEEPAVSAPKEPAASPPKKPGTSPLKKLASSSPKLLTVSKTGQTIKPGTSSAAPKSTETKSPIRKAPLTATSTLTKRPLTTVAKKIEVLPSTKPIVRAAPAPKAQPLKDSKPLLGVKSKLPSSTITKAPLTNGAQRTLVRKEAASTNASSVPKSAATATSKPETKPGLVRSPASKPSATAPVKSPASKPAGTTRSPAMKPVPAGVGATKPADAKLQPAAGSASAPKLPVKNERLVKPIPTVTAGPRPTRTAPVPPTKTTVRSAQVPPAKDKLPISKDSMRVPLAKGKAPAPIGKGVARAPVSKSTASAPVPKGSVKVPVSKIKAQVPVLNNNESVSASNDGPAVPASNENVAESSNVDAEAPEPKDRVEETKSNQSNDNVVDQLLSQEKEYATVTHETVSVSQTNAEDNAPLIEASDDVPFPVATASELSPVTLNVTTPALNDLVDLFHDVPGDKSNDNPPAPEGNILENVTHEAVSVIQTEAQDNAPLLELSDDVTVTPSKEPAQQTQDISIPPVNDLVDLFQDVAQGTESIADDASHAPEKNITTPLTHDIVPEIETDLNVNVNTHSADSKEFNAVVPEDSVPGSVDSVPVPQDE